VIEYGLLSSVTGQFWTALSSTGDTIARYGNDLLGFAVDNPFLFLLLMMGLVVLALFARLR